MRKINMGPTLRRIMRLEKEHLLKHYALIRHKASSLSSNQRRLIESRVAYGVQEGTIKPEEVENAIKELNQFILDQIRNSENNKEDESSNEE